MFGKIADIFPASDRGFGKKTQQYQRFFRIVFMNSVKQGVRIVAQTSITSRKFYGSKRGVQLCCVSFQKDVQFIDNTCFSIEFVINMLYKIEL